MATLARVAFVLFAMVIASPSNTIIKALRELSTARGRRERGLFTVEGVRAVEDGLDAGYWPDICIYELQLLKRTARGQLLLKRLLAESRKHPEQGGPLEASTRALEAASDTQHPQGIVAAFEQIRWPQPVRLPQPALALICDDIQDPGNLGTILRTSEAAGVDAVWLTPRCVDIYNPKVVRAAMGAHFRLPVYPDCDWPAIGQELRQAGMEQSRVFAAEAEAEIAYYTVDWTQAATLIVSNEAHGLSTQARRFVEHGTLISIPMSGGADSLNAAIASAIILFEAARQRALPGR